MPQKQGDTGAFKSLAHVARRLYDLGFNVTPVDSNKKPIGSWNASERLTWEELEGRLPRASGVAITGSYLEDDDYRVVVLDLDDVDAASEVLSKVFGDFWQVRLCGQGWSFCGLTGPRPKGKVICNCKDPNEDCDCVIQDTGERKKLSELPRGMYIVVRVPKRCMPSGTVRSEAIEVMVSNYEVVYGKHPSGVYYQPVRFVDGKWTPIGVEDVGQGEVITCDELKAIIALVKQSTISKMEEAGGEETKTAIELNLPEPSKDLSDAAINQIISLVRPLWWLESDEGKHYHDIILYGLSSLMRRAGIKYEVARRVVESIINAGIQDIAGKVGPTALQAIMRNEERHFRETVDYVYNKSTAKLWGMLAFEENLKPVIQTAIEKGLLSGVSKPDKWFVSIYVALGLLNDFNRAKEYMIRARLPETDIDVSKLPSWMWKFELKFKLCEDNSIIDAESAFLKCNKWIETDTTNDSQYVLLFEYTMKTREVKEEDEEEYGDEEAVTLINIHNYKHLATLPRFMGVAHDPFYKEDYYVAFKDGKLFVTAPINDLDGFINGLRQPPFSIPRSKQYLDLLNEALPRVKMVISPGVTDDGFIDPYGVLDVADYGVEPLLKAYEWVHKYYLEGNAKWAWFNVMSAFAKVLTPIVRYRNRTFNDMVVYNVGRGGEGKSTLVRYVLMQLLGGDDAKEKYYIGIDGAVRTEPQLRNLLSLNRLPLILDEQNRKALANNVGIFLSAVVGLGTTGVQSARYGHGIAVKFKNLRGLVVFTNVSFVSFLRDIVSEASDYAIIRRFIEISWDTEPINPAAFKDLPEIKPIYGFATRLWQKYKDELVKSADLLELIEKLAIAIGREYLGDPKVDEMVRYTQDIIKELREMKRNERLALNDADALVERAYQFVASELKAPPTSAVKVLRYLLENPQKADIKLTVPRNRENLEKLKNELDIAIHKYLMYKYGIEDTSDRGITGKDPDAVALYILLKNAYDEEKVTAVLFARSPLIPGTPKVFLGAPESSFTINGVKKNGYAIPLAKLVRIFLESEVNTENESNGETTGESSSDGETP